MYCNRCGYAYNDSLCPQCGHSGKTTQTPSQEPCAYCGSRPTWPVDYYVEDGDYTLYLCADCEDAETRAVEEE